MKNSNYNLRQIISTCLIAGIGGMLFQWIGIPVPWLLGPMIAVVLGRNVMKWHLAWPYQFRNIGMMVVGYTIGLSMTTAALRDMALQLPTMLLMTVLLMALCTAIAFVVSRLSDSDYQTSLLASLPGGLTQVIALAEETKGINLAVVTVTQVTRLMIIIMVMPLLVMIPFFGQHATGHGETGAIPDVASVSLFPNMLVFAVLGIILAWLGKKIHFPTAALLGPMLATIVLQLLGLQGPHLPMPAIDAAQLLIGTHVGLMLHIDEISQKSRTFSLAIASGVMLVAGSILISLFLTLLHPVSRATALLSLAPGGMDQMGIIAHAIGADLSIVSGYQLFRTFFIYFAIPPLLKLLFKFMIRRRRRRKQGISLH
ncbi:AbrB family transcriptional regulator [Virgibacillus sp. 179-BFC.A HS]|uniref:AbrB family transcriptional regulator n=1 Tax=Tigheibacillus jepli TaxID=3035914 RepID=A0ABU5CL57_9BACI|nr:AbrB family transcriptional regulator [Virgibacillus sp. 179-BFC.A HS]MDY0407088.1 AbrB family transcriptional regulator [Virgibacillus sp. 179-BFC.A HS]